MTKQDHRNRNRGKYMGVDSSSARKNKSARMSVGCKHHPGGNHTLAECYVEHPELRTSRPRRGENVPSTAAVPSAPPLPKKVQYKFSDETKKQLGPGPCLVTDCNVSLISDLSPTIFVDTCCGHNLWIFKTISYFDSYLPLAIPMALGTADISAETCLAVAGYGTI